MNKVNDRWLFAIVYPIIGIVFVHIGNDNTIRELIQIPSYYTDILLGVSITYLIGIYLRWLNKRIENRFDWQDSLKPRITHQILWGILLPTFFAIIVEIIYLSALNIRLGDSSIFYLELPLIVVFLMLLNFAYFVLYYRLHTSQIERTLDDQVKENEASKERFLIAKQGNQNVQVPNSSIAYFISKDRLTFLVTMDSRQYLFDKTMKEVMDMLPKDRFYRLNRQLIAKRDSIVKWSSTETRRLKIELNPPYERDVFVAKTNVTQFVDWVERD